MDGNFAPEWVAGLLQNLQKEDIDRVRAVREAVGEDVDILTDANNAYFPYQAIKMARVLEDYNVYWLEEPVSPDDIEGSMAVTGRTTIPIAAGENEYTRYGFRDLIEKKAVDIINADAQVLGGITEWRKVAAIAAAHNTPVAPHGNQEIHVHLVSAVPNGLILEFYTENVNPLRQKMFEQPLTLQGGQVRPPCRPGLGFEINIENLKRYKVK